MKFRYFLGLALVGASSSVDHHYPRCLNLGCDEASQMCACESKNDADGSVYADFTDCKCVARSSKECTASDCGPEADGLTYCHVTYGSSGILSKQCFCPPGFKQTSIFSTTTFKFTFVCEDYDECAEGNRNSCDFDNGEFCLNMDAATGDAYECLGTAQPLPTTPPTRAPRDWHNGPHGDLILTDWQKEILEKSGFDTSSYRIDPNVPTTRGLQTEEYFNKWSVLNEEGKIVVPYFIHDTVTESYRQQIHDELVDLSFSLGCIELVHDPDLTYDNGVYVIGETSVKENGSTETGCWSFVGRVGYAHDGYGNIINAGWQALRLPDWCIQQGGIHHEFLHALGLLHEQDRPDFEDHFDPHAEGGELAGTDKWFDTGHVLEPSSNLMYPGFTLKNGGSYSAHDLLTTTDAIQVWKQYCEASFSQFPLPAMTTCPSPDVVGAIRPVFHHRLCDSFSNCLGGEDEGSEIVRCEFDLNENGCCASIYSSLFGQTCVSNGLVNDKQSYLCPNGNSLRWSSSSGWTYYVSELSSAYYSNSGTSFGDTSGACLHSEVLEPTFVWGLNNMQLSCVKNGEKTLLPCASSTCNLEVATCVNNANETGFNCVCKDEFPDCDPGNPDTTTTTTIMTTTSTTTTTTTTTTSTTTTSTTTTTTTSTTTTTTTTTTTKTSTATTTSTTTTTMSTTTLTTSTSTNTATTLFSDCPNEFWDYLYDSEQDVWFCAPKTGLVSVVCGSTSMTVTLSTDLFNDNDQYEAKLIDDSSMDCRTVGSLEEDSFTVETALDGCGTVNSLNGANLDFTQVLHVETHSTFISIDKPMDLSFTCSYPSLVTAVFGGDNETDFNFDVSNPQFNATYTGQQTGLGEFSFDINFFTDRFYTNLSSGAAFESGDIVYFGINPSGSDTNSSLPETVTYTVTDCRIINDALSVEFPILADGCAQEVVGFDFEDTSAWPIDASIRPIHNEDSVYFEYMSFRFVSAEDDIDYNEKLSCDITVCDRNDPSSACVATPNCARRRRSSSSLEDLISFE